jgi:hypothetical protein
MLFLQIQALRWANPLTVWPAYSHILYDVKEEDKICIIKIFWDGEPCRLLLGY